MQHFLFKTFIDPKQVYHKQESVNLKFTKKIFHHHHYYMYYYYYHHHYQHYYF